MRDAITPIRQQYLRIKKEHPQAIVLFRLGDFYETFDDDAKITSRELEIVLTSREMGKGNKVPMAGIPYHAIENYLAKLINRGYKVAICEQITKPGETKGIVQREVVRVVSPGTVLETGLLDSKQNNYLVSLAIEGNIAGIAYVDITTGEFATTQIPLSRIENELVRLKPSEIIVAKNTELWKERQNWPFTWLDHYEFEYESAKQALLKHFAVATLDGFGCSGLPLAIKAAGAIIHYLGDAQKSLLLQLTQLAVYSTDSYMALDAQTQNNLELFRTSTGQINGTLLSIIDSTVTSMGGRLIKRWLGQPLLDISEINKRQDAIEHFNNNAITRAQTITILKKISDLERLINRVINGNALPTELIALKRSLATIPELQEVLGREASPIDWLKNNLKPQPEVIDLIARAINPEPFSKIGDGGVIKPGFSEELDNLQSISKNARQYLAGMERAEQEKTGIKSLKIGYNQVFGFYIEVSKTNLAQVPGTYIRKQTLSNGERYYTPELKEYEATILHAKEHIFTLETVLYQQVCKQLVGYRQNILLLAEVLAHLDVLSSLAEVAVNNSYIRPELSKGSEIMIINGRHPVLEKSLSDTNFVPNDTYLNALSNQIIVLTGPNMAGKSTYLKQVALIVLMAQIGCFVPAERVVIGVVDRIFTRIGAREDLASGQSTFMAEMVETANILHNATSKSLLILDEIGRGTSTYDGLSIAKAVVEFIHNYPRLGAKTLFATHYHEMVQIADYLPRVKNYNVAVKEELGDVIFLRKIIPGGVDKSYGIHVAKLAGLPRPVVLRAQEILDQLEMNHGRVISKGGIKKEIVTQITMFGQNSPLIGEIEKIEVDTITPLEAINKLYELQKKAKSLS